MIESLQQETMSDFYAGRSWFQFIEDYSSRKFKFANDILPALGGVITALQKISGDRCYAGLWRRHFLKGLLWAAREPIAEPQALGFWRAPSWSFAAVLCSVVWRSYTSRPGEFCSRFHPCNLIPLGSDPQGKLRSGLAYIFAPMVRFKSLEGKAIHSKVTQGTIH